MNYTEIFERFSSLNILIVGDVMVDAYWWGKVERVSPEAPVAVCAVTKKENRLGGAANVALNVQAMGAKPVICSVIGKDKEGEIMEDLFASHSIGSEGLVRSAERCTTVKTRVIGNNVQMLRIDQEEVKPLSEAESGAFLQRVESIMAKERIDAVILQDYDKGVLTPKVIECVVSLAKARKVPVCVDPKKRNFSAYRNVDLFKPNLKELKEGLKLDSVLPTKEDLTRAAEILNSKQSIGKVFITLSENGVFIADFTSPKPQAELQPAYLRKIADVSGAGDTVISVASLCMAVGLSAGEMAKISNMSGGLVCESVGVVSIDKQRLLAELQKEE